MRIGTAARRAAAPCSPPSSPREADPLADRRGWEIDSHTLTHADLTTLDDVALRHELVESRRELRRRFGVHADFLAYPSGRYGARGATTTDEGVARGRDDAFALPRVRVNGSDTPITLLARLRRY